MTHYTKLTTQELCDLAGLNQLYQAMTWSANNRGVCTLKQQIYQMMPISFWTQKGITHVLGNRKAI